MIKFGFQSSKYNNMTLEQELSFSSASDIDFFDIFFDGYTPEDIANVQLPENFTVHLPIGFAELEKEKQLCFFEFINTRRPKAVTIHFSEYTFEALKEICSHIDGIPVCIENTVPDQHRIYFINYVDYMTRAVAFAKENGFKVCSTFDTGHVKLCGADPVEQIKVLLSNGVDIYTLHLHDNDGVNDSHRPAGSVFNGIDFAAVLSEAQKQAHDVYAVIEHWNNNYNALEYLRNLAF